MRLRRYRWHRWFAWYPVTVKNQRVVFEVVERCLMSNDRFTYRFPKEATPDAPLR